MNHGPRKLTSRRNCHRKIRLLLRWFFGPGFAIARLFLAMAGFFFRTPVLGFAVAAFLITRPVIVVTRAFVSRALDLSQGAAQRFDFTLVSVLLAISQFGEFKHFLHLIEKLLEGDDDFVDVLNGLADGGLLWRWIACQFADAAGYGFKQRPGLPDGCG